MYYDFILFSQVGSTYPCALSKLEAFRVNLVAYLGNKALRYLEPCYFMRIWATKTSGSSWFIVSHSVYVIKTVNQQEPLNSLKIIHGMRPLQEPHPIIL